MKEEGRKKEGRNKEETVGARIVVRTICMYHTIG
jgi:hypothetical protein